jgi:hypothetical protein
MLKKIWLGCGILSSLLYVAIDGLAALRYPGYHSYLSQAISELGAVGAPTKELVQRLFIAYDALLIAFGLALWASSDRKRALRFIGALLIGIAVVGAMTPPMHVRGTGGPSGDLPHIVLTGVIVLFILSAIAIGASLYGRKWRLYSWATLVVIIASGALTGVAAGQLAAGQPTPWLGIAERINIGGYLLWVAVLAGALLRESRISTSQQPVRATVLFGEGAVHSGPR